MPEIASNTSELVASARTAVAVLAGKYLTFQLANEDYGIEILKVREIIGFMEITRMARAPAFIRGVINLRGKIVPVVDLRLQFGLDSCAATDQTVIIVVQCQVAGRPLTMGVLVDRVLEVLSVSADQVEPPPDLGDRGKLAEFIMGIGKSGQRIVFLLDIARALSAGVARVTARPPEPAPRLGETNVE